VIVGLDTETGLASNAAPIPPLVSVAVCDGVRTDLIHHSDPAAPRVVAAAYAQGVAIMNAPFDGWVLAKWRPELLPLIVDAYHGGRVHDVGTREKMIDIAEGAHKQRGKYNLGAISARRAGLAIDKSDPWRTRYIELINTPIASWPADAQRYAAWDAYAHWACFHAQAQHDAITGRDFFQAAPEVAAKHWALYAQTLRGIPTDPEFVRLVATAIDAEIEFTRAQLIGFGLARPQGRKIVCDTKRARSMMAQYCRDTGQVVGRTSREHVSLSAETMARTAIPDGHPLDVYRRHQGLRALRTKNVPPFQRPVIRTRYDEAVDTARTSSTGPQGKRKVHQLAAWEWSGTNVQNLVDTRKLQAAVRRPTPGLRECLIASPGEALVISDWSGFELVANAQNQLDELGDSRLADALRAGDNPHTSIACAWLGIDPASFDKKLPAHNDERQLAKKWNFGRWGGMGDTKFQQIVFRDMGVTLFMSEIKRRNEVWRARWEAERYFDWIKRQPSETRPLPDGRRMTTYTMRHRRSGWIKGGCSYTEACNFPFQHLAAMAAGTALWWLWLDSCRPESPLFRGDWPTTQILFVHDEIVTSVPRERAEEARARQDEIMVAAAQRWCPDVPCGVESWVSERYDK